MSKQEQFKTECEQCAYNEEYHNMCNTCFLGSNFISKNKQKLEVILCIAVTADGMIAKDERHSCDWTPKADKEHFKKLTRDAQVVIMGSKTFDTLKKPLPGRLNIVMTRDTTKSSESPLVLYTNQSPNVILHGLSKRGYSKVCVVGGAITNTEFLRRELIDTLCVTIVPKLFGTGIPMFKNINLNTDLDYVSSQNIGDGCFKITYDVKYNGEN